MLILLLYSNYLLCFRLDQLWLGDFYISLIPAYNTQYCHFLSALWLQKYRINRIFHFFATFYMTGGGGGKNNSKLTPPPNPLHLNQFANTY